MDATAELPAGRFDAIAVTGSVQVFDPRFVEALSIGGRLFVVVGDSPVMDAHVVTRTGDSDWDSVSLFEQAVFVHRPLAERLTADASADPRTWPWVDWDEAHLIASANMRVDRNGTTKAETSLVQKRQKRSWHAFSAHPVSTTPSARSRLRT